MPRAATTQCGQGHRDFMIRRGKRECRACRNEGKRRTRERNRIRSGMPAVRTQPNDTAWDRIRMRLDRSGECWLWTGQTDAEGYAEVRFRGKRIKAHRAVYEHFTGPIPNGLELDHLCHTPSCLRPDHLEAVSHRENVLRGTGFAARNAGKTHCIHGHEFTPENLLTASYRACRQCSRERKRRHYLRKKSALYAQNTTFGGTEVSLGKADQVPPDNPPGDGAG
jgi:HNH endonuclease